MSEFFNKISQGAKQAATQAGLATKIAKLGIEIKTQESEKERYIKTIGGKVYAIFAKNGKLDGSVIKEEISSELSLIERIDRHIEDLQADIEDLRAEMRSGPEGKDYVDAPEVKEADDDHADDK